MGMWWSCSILSAYWPLRCQFATFCIHGRIEQIVPTGQFNNTVYRRHIHKLSGHDLVFPMHFVQCAQLPEGRKRSNDLKKIRDVNHRIGWWYTYWPSTSWSSIFMRTTAECCLSVSCPSRWTAMYAASYGTRTVKMQLHFVELVTFLCVTWTRRLLVDFTVCVSENQWHIQCWLWWTLVLSNLHSLFSSYYNEVNVRRITCA